MNRPGSAGDSDYLDFDQGLAGPWCIVERGFELGRRDVVEVAVEAAVVVSVHPAQSAHPAAEHPVTEWQLKETRGV